MDTKRTPVIAAERGSGAEWRAGWETLNLEGRNVEVEGQGLVLGKYNFSGEVEWAEDFEVDQVGWGMLVDG